MPKIDVRELDFIDDDYIGYEKIRKTPKKESKSEEKPKSEPKKSDVKDS
jgi:hypothetical protein